MFKLWDHIYSPDDIEKVINKAINEKQLKGNNKGVYMYNIACSFDIETSSFYITPEGKTITNAEYTNRCKKIKNYKALKQATMYIWQLGINGYKIVGRTWDEFLKVCKTLSETLHLNDKKRLIIYVHNLSYEFGFMCHWFKWEKVFSLDTRKPCYALSSGGIEFRCSYILSGYSLKNLAKQCIKYPCKKMEGDLDYSLIRHSMTPLTDKELKYCTADIDVVMCYIQEKIENDGNITKIPLTKTGYVRKYCRKKCLYYNGTNKRDFKYSKLMDKLKITPDEYKTLKRAFQGGFTHANAYHVNTLYEKVSSFDFTSSYPYVMVSEKYPMSRGVKVDVKDKETFVKYINNYLCIFDITFYNLIPKKSHENPLSVSKCWSKSGVVENNGRVVLADKVTTTITNIDFTIFEKFYKWDQLTIHSMYIYHADYLPTCFVTCILDLYSDKTKLKGVKGKEVEYQASKEMVNACYGMCVTDPLQELITFDGVTWGTEKQDLSEELEKHNNSMNRFLFYPWGVFVTAYARRNLFMAIEKIGNDYIYADTDSVKILNAKKYQSFFDSYNSLVDYKLKKACEYHNIPFEKTRPETVKGIKKPLGVWDYEGEYKYFKTLGAKRYMTFKDNELSMTVSGVNKFVAIPYLLEKYNNNILKIFDIFDNDLSIPPEKSGKNIHTYIDGVQEGSIIDYKGVKYKYFELSSVHLEPTGYNLSMAEIFIKYLLNIKQERI